MVGDRWRDVDAGQAAGCRDAYFIDYGYREQQPAHPYVAVDRSPRRTVHPRRPSQRSGGHGSDHEADLKPFKVKLFADGADLAGMKEMAANPISRVHDESRR